VEKGEVKYEEKLANAVGEEDLNNKKERNNNEVRRNKEKTIRKIEI
jgi:hypothetical protein